MPTADNIPLGTRILAMADAYDTIVSDRVYRLGRSHEEAIAELQLGAGVQFYPGLDNTFISTLNEQRKLLSNPSPLGALAEAGLVAPAARGKMKTPEVGKLQQLTTSGSTSLLVFENSPASDPEAAILQAANQLLQLSSEAQQANPKPTVQSTAG